MKFNLKERQHASKAVRYLFLFFNIAIVANVYSQESNEHGVLEIHNLQFGPDVIIADQEFTVTLAGYNISAFEHLGPPDGSTFEVSVIDNEIILDSDVTSICTSPAPPLPIDTSPHIRTYTIPGVPEGEYIFKVKHTLNCEVYQAEAERSLVIYPIENNEMAQALESPREGQVVSGVGLIRGWACYVKDLSRRDHGPLVGKVEYSVDGSDRIALAYATVREDTVVACGENNELTGYGGVNYWGSFGEGEHEFTLFIDGIERESHMFTVVVPEEGFMTGVESAYELEGFPIDGRDVKIEWSQSDQNFIVTQY